jgi:NADPH:quinone reductase-like Zn-dependent oxidoreductase
VVPGHEVSGVVAALGFGTAGLTAGQEVYGLTDGPLDGRSGRGVGRAWARDLVLELGTEEFVDAEGWRVEPRVEP